MLNFIHIFGLTLFTLIFKYFFLKDLYFYLDDFSIFANLESTQSIFPEFTDRPLIGLFLLLIFQIFKWNSVAYHILGAVLEIITNLTVYYVVDRLIWHNKFYSSLTVLFFLLIPGHSQQYWWVILLSLKILLIMCLVSIYCFHKFILTNQTKWLLWSSFCYGIPLFGYELALFLPIVHLLLFINFVILRNKSNWVTSLKCFSFFAPYILTFLTFRFTKSFGLSAAFNRTDIVIKENVWIRSQKIVETSILGFPEMDQSVGLQEFLGSNLTSLTLVFSTLIMFFLLITWFTPIFKNKDDPNFFKKSDYIFILTLSICIYIYPLIPFFLTSAWFDTRHNYLPHLGLAILIVLIIRLVLENLQKINQKQLQYVAIIISLYVLTQILVQGATSMIGLGIIWRGVGLDLKSYEVIVKEQFPTVQTKTLFLIKDAEKLRQTVPVFAGDWVVNGFFAKIYPLQKVKGNYYNLSSEDSTDKLLFKINPGFDTLNVAGNQYPFNQVIILDGKSQLRAFSAVRIKTPQGDYLRKLQTSPTNDNVGEVLEISTP